jgi:hypothetical protein
MEIRNPGLYTALVNRFKYVEVTGVGKEGAYSCPSEVAIGRFKQDKTKPYAKVSDWGETYHVDCPNCGDTRKRLYISHFTGTKTSTSKTKCKKTGIEKSGGWYLFGLVYDCKNEGCYLNPLLKQIVEEGYKISPEQIIKTKPGKYFGGLIDKVDLPVNYPLTSPLVPEEVIQYIYSRRYTPSELDADFDVRYLPKGSKLWTGQTGKDIISWDDRLLIPITRAYKIIGWQARAIKPHPIKHLNKKYIFPPLSVTTEGKSQWLYNMSAASYCTDLVIVEGVTDVWRIGKNAVATFGKSVSEEQLKILKLVWGSFASCVIVFDGEAEAYAKAKEIETICREQKIFKNGITALRLAEGYDPDNYSREEITNLITEARKLCR